MRAWLQQLPQNIPYFDFPDFEEVVCDECGKLDGTRFEPGVAKNIVARATLYFLLRYPGNIKKSYDAKRLATLVCCYASHPVTDYELHRNMRSSRQGNRKSLTDHPEWATEIYFKQGCNGRQASGHVGAVDGLVLALLSRADETHRLDINRVQRCPSG